MKQVNHDTYQRLQQMIDSLQTDKELLRVRLLKANHDKLNDGSGGDYEVKTPTEGGASQRSAEEE